MRSEATRSLECVARPVWAGTMRVLLASLSVCLLMPLPVAEAGTTQPAETQPAASQPEKRKPTTTKTETSKPPAKKPAAAQTTTTQPATPKKTPVAAKKPATSKPAGKTTRPASGPARKPAAKPTTAPAKAPEDQDPELPGLAVGSDDVVVFLGDELTDTPRPTTTNSFPMLVETFLAARYPSLKTRFINVGWAGDTVARALRRLDRDVLSHDPTVVVVCLGLNDPEYRPVSDQRVDAYTRDLSKLAQRCRKAGSRVWIISPPAVDEEKGRKVRILRGGRPGVTDLKAIHYNATLARYAKAAKQVAEQTNSGFVDWFAEMTAAYERQQQTKADPKLNGNGLHPGDRAHAMVAAGLLKAWGAEPIETTIELNWTSGEVKVTSHLGSAGVDRAEINASGERRIMIRGLPLPWPLAGGKGGILGADWEATALCAYMLRVPDAPERGVIVKLEWPQDQAVHDGPVPAGQLRDGFNLASSDALHAAKEIAELFQLIGTKNHYHYGAWRKLALAPPKEPELVEAHRQLIVAWRSYVTGTEKIIQNQPRTIDLHLVLSEAVPVEQLPTAQARPSASTRSPASDITSVAPKPRPASDPESSASTAPAPPAQSRPAQSRKTAATQSAAAP